MGESMSLMSCIKKAILIVSVLGVFASPLSAAEKDQPYWSNQELKRWLGKKVDVNYQACDSNGCVVVRSAMLKKVTEDAIIVFVNDAPFLIPKYMIKAVKLSK
jgi:hypothetical protein